MRHFLALIFAWVAFAAAPAAAPPAKLPISTFTALPSIQSPGLSPDGRHVAAKISVGGQQVLAIISLFEKDKRQLFAHDEADFDWWDWVNDDWLIVGLGQKQKFNSEDVYITRLLAVERSTGKLVKIRWDAPVFRGDAVIWKASDGTPRIKMQTQTTIYESEGAEPYVVTIDVPTGRVLAREPSYPFVWRWHTDASGAVRLGWGYRRDRNLSFLVRRAGADGPFEKVLLDRKDPPEGTLGPSGNLLVLADEDGNYALWEYDPATQKFGTKVFGMPGVDVDDVVRFRDSDKVAGARLLDDVVRTHWLDPEMAEIQGAIDKAVAPGVAEIISASRDKSALLVKVTHGQSPGRLYYFSAGDGKMRVIGQMAANLAGVTLAPMKPVKYKSRDGLDIPGYLTLPPGREPKGLPLVVMPHGGPWGRDHLGYDHWVQFLANRGYAVLQPNFRGSTGYGEAFEEKGHAQMGIAMQDDLTDGVRWLAADGTVDLARVCIMGGSYGGYAAMWGTVRDPDLYRCAISFAGVADVPALLRYDRENLLFGKRVNARFRELAPDVKAVSPILAVDRIKTPMLLVHGKGDLRVPVEQSRRMAAALRRAGKPVEYLEQPLGDHNLSREEDRVSLLNAVEAFLSKHNPAS